MANDVVQVRPDPIADIGPDRQVVLDVRPILREGGEPFSQIMEALSAVPAGHVFVLRATFKPLPLFGVLRVKGWKHWIEFGDSDDWVVWFYREKESATS